MDRPLFIGDETTAAGYRLAGLEVRSPSPEAAAAELDRARDRWPPLILITAEYAAHLQPAELERFLSRAEPPLQVVTDAAGRVPVPDLAARIRARVGVES
ncbi:MAG TPA: V-type ATP synthase subunit F [Gammaproteobacteria bacterium]|nr:V-type ATP synthase subunit F [Gammaproteobacteria bacterium]